MAREIAYLLLKMAPTIRHLPPNPVFGYYLAELTAEPNILPIHSLPLVCGWIAVRPLEQNLHDGSSDDAIVTKS